MSIDDSLPTDLASAHTLIIAQRQALIAAQSEAQHRALLIEKLKYTIKKLRHEQFGQSSERGALLDQLELQLADLEEDAAQAEAAAAAETITVPSFERRKPARRPLPAHLPRERIVYPAPSACPCCGDHRFTRFLDDGRLCMTNNAAERELRAVAVGRKNWTFAGSDEGGRRAAAIYTLIQTAKLNDVDPQAWLADILARLPDHQAKRIDELLPWNWVRARQAAA